ncbi:hypothetical protein J4536_02705, partial [Escherichia coli]|nr:hypothetical protein [Escherichia coli]
ISRASDNPSITRDVAGEGVQQELLKRNERTVTAFPPKSGSPPTQPTLFQVVSSWTLFDFGGALAALDKIFYQRLQPPPPLFFFSLFNPLFFFIIS